MKKRIIIILLVLIIISVILGLYHTYAIDSTIDTVSTSTYSITLTGNNEVVKVPKKTSKTVYYQISNTNKAVVRYGVGYSSDNIKVKVWDDTIDAETGFIGYGENKFIKLKLINNSTMDSEVKLSTILGYEHGGDLIVPEGTTLVTEKIKEINYIKGGGANKPEDNYLNTTLPCNSIEKIKFVKDNIVPEGVIGSFDVSQNQDKSIMLWYTDVDNNNLYEVNIGSESGIVYMPSSWKMFAHLSNMKEIDLTYFNTSKATTFIYMFYGCSSLTKLNLSKFDTSNVTNMYAMFMSCYNLTDLNLSSFNMGSVTSTNQMFRYCSKLSKIDFRNADFSNVTDYSGMFANVPNDSVIYVKDTTQKDWLEGKFTNLTGVTIY